MTIDSTDIRILSATALAGKAHPDFLISFFSRGCNDTVILGIESLVRRKLLKWERDLLVPTDEGLKYSKLSELFGCCPLDKDFVPQSPLNGISVSAYVNKIISGKPLNQNLYNRIKRLAMATGAVYMADDRFVPDIPTVIKLTAMTNADLTLTLTESSFGKEAKNAVRDFMTTLSKCPTTQAGMLSMLTFHLLLCASQAPAGGIAELLLSLNTIVTDGNSFAINPRLRETPVERTKPFECDTDMSIRLTEDSTIPSHIWLYCDNEKTDIVSEWTLTRAGLFRALDSGLSVNNIKEELKTDIFDQILSQWESSYNRIRVYDSCVVRCSEDLVPVLENLPSLKEHVMCRITDCVYLMKKSTSRTWHEILCNVCHLEHLPLSIRETAKPAPESTFTTGEQFTLSDQTESAHESPNAETDESRLFEYFNVGNTITATGMDYNGKNAIIRNAVRSGRTYLLVETLDGQFCTKPLEIIRTEDKGNLVKILILPAREEKLISVSSIYRVTSLEAFSSHSSSRASF